MFTELTFTVLKYAFLILLWVFVCLIARSLYRDVASFSPRKSRSRRRKDRQARRKAEAPTPVAQPMRVPATGQLPVQRTAAAAAAPAAAPAAAANTAQPTLLVIIDGPLAGTSIPLGDDVITLGRAASNNVVLDDEFVSSHHARVYHDASGAWAIEDLHSTNGTVVNQQRIDSPTILAPRVPVRIGATTFELR